MIFLSIFYLIALQSEAIEAATNYISNIHQANFSMSTIPQVDAVGGIIEMIDAFLTQTSRNSPRPTQDKCESSLMKLGENEIKASQNPYGYCTYCCPMKNPEKHVNLYFTNKTSGSNMVRLKMGRKPGAVSSAGVNNTLPTIIFIHGFTEHGLGPCPSIVRDAYLSRAEDFNIILVDWGDLSSFPWYPQAVENTKSVATVLARFIKYYNSRGELPISKIHLVGFSLGAQVAGFVGKYLKGIERIPRITALDPARPLYRIHDISQRISRDDADYVDVIHTDAGKFGFPISVGHADFYPNGGTFVQPGCEVSSLAETQGIEQFGSCGHVRAWRYYVESVRNPTAFPATKCGIMQNGSYKQCGFIVDAYMGFPANKKTTLGNFYLTTNDRKPFAKSAQEQKPDMKTINLIL